MLSPRAGTATVTSGNSRTRPGQDDRDPVAIVGADTVPLPMPRALALAGPLKALPFVDGGLVDAALARMRELAGGDVSSARVVIHGDIYLGNVLVDGRGAGRPR
jgi:hypothetical protein